LTLNDSQKQLLVSLRIALEGISFFYLLLTGSLKDDILGENAQILLVLRLKTLIELVIEGKAQEIDRKSD